MQTVENHARQLRIARGGAVPSRRLPLVGIVTWTIRLEVYARVVYAA
jgi:hypothetical protein